MTTLQGADPVEQEQLRLITRVAWLYHMRGLKQSQVADMLGLSQSRVSRLLESASKLGVVRTTVRAPAGLQLELEHALIESYGIRDAQVLDVPEGDDAGLISDLGQFLAGYLNEKPLSGDIIGFTSWSRTLRETVPDLEAPADASSGYVVQMLGDVGPPDAQHDAAEVTRQLARLLGAQPRFLRVPGVLKSGKARRTLLSNDPHAREALSLLDNVNEALVGIGTCEVDPPLRAGDNFFTLEQFAMAKKMGAVGQVNLRFIDADGHAVSTELDELVIGVTLEQLHKCERTIAVAGGPAKQAAIRGALLGGWVNTLVTDTATARHLVESANG